VSQLEVQTDVNIIEFTEAEQAAIQEAYPVANFSIGADTYTTLTEDARSVSMWNFSIANCDLLPENWDKNNVLMWHPGAAKWFRENAKADIPDDMVFSK